MTDLGYALSSEEHSADDLVDHAVEAENRGFGHALVSDHFHPWVSRQGNAPFVWSTLGAIARETESLRVGTGVTCPIQRIHPAIVAQAAATAATMFDGRFFLGVGTGENLNEHVTGDPWPAHDVRNDRLVEAIQVIDALWGGEEVTHRGEHFTVEDARLYTLPEEPPDIYVAADGPTAAKTAGEVGDGMIAVAPDESLVEAYAEARDGLAGPRYGQVTVCWAEDEATARETAHEWWPNTAIPGGLSWDIRTPAQFEQLVTIFDEEDVAAEMPTGPDVDAHVEAIEEFVDAGFDHVYVHQVGPDQAGFFDFYESEVLPSFG